MKSKLEPEYHPINASALVQAEKDKGTVTYDLRSIITLIRADLDVDGFSWPNKTMKSKIINPQSDNQNTFETRRLTGRRKSEPRRLIYLFIEEIVIPR